MDIKTNNRRRFIKNLVFSVTSGFALICANRLTAKPQSKKPEPSQANTQGYRETEHVKAYYRSARF